MYTTNRCAVEKSGNEWKKEQVLVIRLKGSQCAFNIYCRAPTTRAKSSIERRFHPARFAIWDCVWQLNKSSFFPPFAWLTLNYDCPKTFIKTRLPLWNQFDSIHSHTHTTLLISGGIPIHLRTHNQTIHKYMSNKIHLVWSPWKNSRW